MKSNTKSYVIRAAQWTWIVSIAFQAICALFYFSELKLNSSAQYAVVGSIIVVILVFINVLIFSYFKENA